MPEIKELREDLERAVAQAKAIRLANPHGLSGEARVDFDRHKDRAAKLHEQIDQETKRLADDRELADHDRFLTQPQRTLVHGVNGDDDDHKALTDRGWELKSGGWYAPTSSGPYPMYPEEVLYGPIPERDPAAAQYVKQVRATMGVEYKAAYIQYLRNSARQPEAAYGMLSPSEQKALSEGSDPAGGFLVPPDTQAEVLARVAQKGVMRRLARVVNTSRDVLRFPAVAPHATLGSIYSSGFVGTWVGETPAFAETDPSFQLFDIAIKKARVATKLSNDFIADAVVSPLAFLAQNGAENLALVEDNGFIAGDGAALQPLGILNSGAATVDVEGSTANTISSASGAGSHTKIVTLAYTVPAAYASGASWLMRRSIEGKVRGLADSSGRPIWLSYLESGFGPTPPTILSAPVYNSDFMPSDGTDANKVMIYGDIGQYIIAQRAQITSMVLRERFADTDQTGIILFERVGGAMWNTDAIRIGIV